MPAGQTHTFSGVEVGLPSKVSGNDAEDEWQEVDWVSWSQGEITVDAASYLLVFKPSNAAVKAKPLGTMLRASVAEQGEEGRTMVVTTTDTLNRLYRVTFKIQKDLAAFKVLAEQAEVSQASAGESALDTQAQAAARMARQKALQQQISAEIGNKDLPVLVFGGAELCGPDANNPTGGEVLLGTGAAVLLDPLDDGTVGKWELIFFGEDDGTREPVARFVIGPRTRLVKKKVDPGEGGPVAMFALTVDKTVAGMPHTISFEEAEVAANFARDFRVRQRVMELSLKNVHVKKNSQELLGEIRELKGRTLGARLWQFFTLVILVLLMVAMTRLALLYKQDHGARKPVEYLKALGQDAQTAVRRFRPLVMEVGSKVCDAAFGAVPSASLRQCLEADTGSKELRFCTEQLAGR